MEAQLVVQCKSPFSTSAHRRLINRAKHPLPILFVLTKPTDGVKKLSNSKSVHNDTWFDNIAIHHLSHAVQSTIGLRNYKSGYESLVEAAMATSHNFNSIQQCEVVIKALEKAFPKPILAMIRALIPNSKFTREFFAVFTSVFFKWLVGPSEVRDSELNGRTERNVVHIKKCRFLEESNCVGMCINLCKIPSQTFIKDSLGMPINMVPNFNTLVSYINMKTLRDAWVYKSGKGQIVFFIHHSKQDFDDMSCEMIYGQDPPPTTEDPVFKQPCYTLCKVKQRHSTNCSS